MSRRLWQGLGVIALAGCATSAPESTVEIYSWWVSGAEQVALDAVLKNFAEANPNVQVTNAAAQDSLNAQDELQIRMRLGDPPDLFQINGGAELMQYAPEGSLSLLVPLDDLATAENWKQVVPPVVWQAITASGHVYAVPVDIARVNALFYNKHLFDDNGLTPPTSLVGFVEVAQALQDKILRPVAIGDKVPWTLEVIFKSCLAAAGQANYYAQFVQGVNGYFAGTDGTTFDPIFNSAVECFATIVSYADKTLMRSEAWNDAVLDVVSGHAAMTIMGDWALGEFLKDGAVADQDFGEIPAPDSQDTFIFTTDSFVLPVGAKNRSGALALLAVWGSASGQNAFYPLKGTLAARSDVDSGAYDIFARNTLQEFSDAEDAGRLVPDWPLAFPQAFSTIFDAALDRFVDDGNAENLVLTVKNNYDLLTASH
jgi:glucose/mannose transport system substrate-binding protein